MTEASQLAESTPAEAPAARVEVRTLFMLGALLCVGTFFALYGSFGGRDIGFLTARNLSLLSIELASSGVLALGMLLVIVPGHVDLAAGSAVGLNGGIAAMLVIDPAGLARNMLGLSLAPASGLPAWLAMLATLLFSMLLYAGMGALVAYQRMPAFIVTLGGLLALKGLHWKAIANATVPVAPGGHGNALSALTTAYLPTTVCWVALAGVFTALLGLWLRRARTLPAAQRETSLLGLIVAGQLLAIALLVAGRYRGVPLAAVLLALVAVLVHTLTQKTTTGRYLYAIGGNEQAARFAGIDVPRVTVTAFVAMGAIAALSGLLQTSYAGSSTTTIGQLMELDAVAACVIGGASLKGGRGGVGGVLFGALIMGVLLNGMTLMAVSPENKLIARGVVLAFAVWVDLRLSRQR